LTDVSSNHVRLGIGGPHAGEAVQRAFGAVPLPMTAIAAGQVTLLGLAGSRFALVAPAANASAARSALKPFVRESDFAVWQWLTIRAGVPIVTATTQDAFVAQTANWDLLGGVDFQKGCYTGQEIIARTQYLGRLKERTFLFHARVTDIAAGTRLYSPVFADQPCGTVINAAPAPGGGSDLLAVLQLAAAERDDTRLGEPSGPVLERLPLPYPIPEPAAPRPRKV
jgi:folate-binding protein YgfZ